MEQLRVVAQIVIAVGIINVWLLRFSKSTSWRAANSRNMKEEFEAYGLSASFMKLIGLLKISLAALLIASLWLPAVTKPAAGILGMLMLAAVFMHIKVKDPMRKSLPAFSLLLLCLLTSLS